MNWPSKAWRGRRLQFVCGTSAYSEQPGTRRASINATAAWVPATLARMRSSSVLPQEVGSIGGFARDLETCWLPAVLRHSLEQ